MASLAAGAPAHGDLEVKGKAVGGGLVGKDVVAAVLHAGSGVLPHRLGVFAVVGQLHLQRCILWDGAGQAEHCHRMRASAGKGSVIVMDAE